MATRTPHAKSLAALTLNTSFLTDEAGRRPFEPRRSSSAERSCPVSLPCQPQSTQAAAHQSSLVRISRSGDGRVRTRARGTSLLVGDLDGCAWRRPADLLACRIAAAMG